MAAGKMLAPAALLLIVMATCEGSYEFAIPKVIRPGTTMQIGVSIAKTRGDVTISTQLVQNANTKQEKSVASASDSMKSDTTKVLTLQVPTELSGSYTIKVSGSGGLKFTNTSETLTVKRKTTSVLIQTDKAIYKPGQTVKFRIIPVTLNLLPSFGSYSIEVYDAENNKIKQWLNESSTSAAPVNSREIELSDQPILGDWRIQVKKQDETFSAKFTIEKYILPRFKVSVSCQPFMVISAKPDINCAVTSIYTYGKPVKGTAEVSITMPTNNMFRGITETIQMTEDGGQVTVPYEKIENFMTNGAAFQVSVVAKEGVSLKTGKASTQIIAHNSYVKLEVMKISPDHFKPGLKYTFFIKVTQPDGTTLTETGGQLIITQKLYMIKGKYETKETAYPVPTSGVVRAAIDSPQTAYSLSYTATYHSKPGSPILASLNRYISKFKSEGSHGIQVLLRSASVKAGDTITFEVKTTLPSVKYTYYILSRGKIVASGQGSPNNVAVSTFQVVASSDMAPGPQIVIYQITTEGEVIVDSLKFSVSGIFRNKVGLTFTPQDKVKPGTEVVITVETTPGSYVGILAIDKSVTLLKTGNDITKDKVLQELQTYDSDDDDKDDGPMPFFRAFPFYGGGTDAAGVLKKSGLILLTDNFIFKEEIMVMEDVVAAGNFVRKGSAKKKKVPTATLR